MLAIKAKTNLQEYAKHQYAVKKILNSNIESLTDLDLTLTNQFMSIFVGKNDENNEFTYTTNVGAYCVRLFNDGVWMPIVLDDLFPMLRRDDWTTENR